MAKTFREWNVEQAWLLPPSVKDFVPEDHLAHFIRELVREQLDLSAIVDTYTEERGFPPYHPVMMTALPLYVRSAASRCASKSCQSSAADRRSTGRASTMRRSWSGRLLPHAVRNSRQAAASAARRKTCPVCIIVSIGPWPNLRSTRGVCAAPHVGAVPVAALPGPAQGRPRRLAALQPCSLQITPARAARRDPRPDP